ncbi:ankyrin repeat domain-containing protein [Parashewanella curva]|uniref:Ankyrin repeat domain-containing protein n=1 Tax=Parashewanella curva TaxID=2338552 RepID=A0A3L8PV83_9GAMM|nr:ankyrin repeat domain-containing protein [Parashewanella curva]RLV58338.1 ankyrin repeat domain-containing protein [Parashewanella curva]
MIHSVSHHDVLQPAALDNIALDTAVFNGRQYLINQLDQFDAFILFIRRHTIELPCSATACMKAAPSERQTDSKVLVMQEFGAIIERYRTLALELYSSDKEGKQDYLPRLAKLDNFIRSMYQSGKLTDSQVADFTSMLLHQVTECPKWEKHHQKLFFAAFPMEVDCEAEWQCLSGIQLRLLKSAKQKVDPFSQTFTQWQEESTIALLNEVGYETGIHIMTMAKWLITGIKEDSDVHFKYPLIHLYSHHIYDLLVTSMPKFLTMLNTGVSQYLLNTEQMLRVKNECEGVEDIGDEDLEKLTGLQERFHEAAWTVYFKVWLMFKKSAVAPNNEKLKRHVIDNVTQELSFFFHNTNICQGQVPPLSRYTTDIVYWCERLQANDFSAYAALLVVCLKTPDTRPFLLFNLIMKFKESSGEALLQFLTKQKDRSIFLSCWYDQIHENVIALQTLLDTHETILKPTVSAVNRSWTVLNTYLQEKILRQFISEGASLSVFKAIASHGIKNVDLTDLNWKAWLNSPEIVTILDLLKEHIDLNEELTTYLPNVGGNYQLIHIAIAFHNDALLSFLLQQPDVELTPKNRQLMSPLYFACWIGRNNEVKKLLEYQSNHLKIDIGLRQSDAKTNLTPFQKSCQLSNTSLIKIFVDFCLRQSSFIDVLFEPDIKTKTTPFQHACALGKLGIVKIYLDLCRERPSLIRPIFSIHPITKLTPVHAACKFERLGVLKLLFDVLIEQPKLERELLAVEQEGFSTPIHYVCELGKVNLMEFFLEFCKNVEATTPCLKKALFKQFILPHAITQSTPFMAACIHGHKQIVQVMLKFQTENPEFELATEQRHTGSGSRPIHAAFLHRQYDVVKALLLWGGIDATNASKEELKKMVL